MTGLNNKRKKEMICQHCASKPTITSTQTISMITIRSGGVGGAKSYGVFRDSKAKTNSSGGGRRISMYTLCPLISHTRGHPSEENIDKYRSLQQTEKRRVCFSFFLHVEQDCRASGVERQQSKRGAGGGAGGGVVLH